MKVMMSFKNIFKSALAMLVFGGFTAACSDMLETESTRQNIEPSIGEKTDSVFYAFGILQAMQQLADQYVMQGEMRGDLVKTTRYTDNNLRQLANFTATTANKYDSAYVYYRVINNCNYYIAHCDTNQYNGSTNIVKDKYVAAKAIRAWAYLQLGRNYERVPYFTEPLTQISQIDRDYPELTLSQLAGELTADLEQYSGMKVPSLGSISGTTITAINVGSPNWESTAKAISPSHCFIPVDVVMGDLYLEAGNYDAAARHYITYFNKAALQNTSSYLAPMASKTVSTGRFGMDDDLPDLRQINTVNAADWSIIFSRNNINDIITYIPMATTAQNGKTTELPLIFGFDYYATPGETSRSGAPYVDEIQLLPSDALNQLSDSTEYYYYVKYQGQTNLFDSVRIAKAGDMRLRSILHQELEEDSVKQWIDKYKYATVVLYRVSTIWLRLAECFNRLGMPDAAFAILKDGVSDQMLATNSTGAYVMSYLTDYSRSQLRDNYQLISRENLANITTDNAFGIHTHGAGKAASDYPGTNQMGGHTYNADKSPYQLSRMAGLKMEEIAKTFGVTVGTTKQDTINAIEDIICDEYALETAFEGNRYFDLMRLARHKNAESPAGYPANFGYLWLQKKLEGRGWSESTMYLPFK